MVRRGEIWYYSFRRHASSGGHHELHVCPDISTGVEASYVQHQELFKRLNTLLDACAAQQKGKDEIGTYLAFLEEYVIQHFSSEEAAMAVAAYLGLPAHKVEHDCFKQRLASIKKEFLEMVRRSTSLCLRSERPKTGCFHT
mgnify:FL=1